MINENFCTTLLLEGWVFVFLSNENCGSDSVIGCELVATSIICGTHFHKK